MKIWILNHRSAVIISAALIVVLAVAVAAYSRFAGNQDNGQPGEEVDLSFDPDGPYALLFPRRDGNALVLNLKRTASYDAISYELAYVSQAETPSDSADGETASFSGGIDRGVVGNINTQEKKGEYEQEILFGTCSRNVCKYDKGVENGTLTLHIKKGNKAYRMVTQWHLQKPAVALGVLTSGDSHLAYRIASGSADLDLVSNVIINDLSGAPKLPAGKQVVGKVYATNSPEGSVLSGGEVKIELADSPPAGSKIALWKEAENRWVEYDTKAEGGTLSAQADASGIITILAPK